MKTIALAARSLLQVDSYSSMVRVLGSMNYRRASRYKCYGTGHDIATGVGWAVSLSSLEEREVQMASRDQVVAHLVSLLVLSIGPSTAAPALRVGSRGAAGIRDLSHVRTSKRFPRHSLPPAALFFPRFQELRRPLA